MNINTCDCGHAPSEHSKHTTGYGYDKNGKTACYSCCAKADIEYMDKHGKTTLYLTNTDNEYFVTNWPGSLVFRVGQIKTGRHNIAGIRYDFWFKDNSGNMWHGTQYGDNTQIAHCKRLKSCH